MQTQGFDNPLAHDHALYDFINDGIFDQFIDCIRGENGDPTVSYDRDFMFSGGMMDAQLGLVDIDVFNSNSTSEPSSILDFPLPVSGDMEVDNGENEEDNSSTDTTTQGKSQKGDRSRTLVSERRRRSSMKEKLYALRSLVPNITKMDKASIVGDAVSYVQNLQMQAKKIKAEIARLEASVRSELGYGQVSVENPNNSYSCTDYKPPISGTILQMDVFQVEEKEYYVRMVCNKGERVVVALHKALELLPFSIKSSNFAKVSEKFVLTVTVDVKECQDEMSVSTMKLLVTGALLNQRFNVKIV